MGETEGFVQIVAEKDTDKILGCSIVGSHATDLIGEATVAIKAGLKAKDIAGIVHAHPTLPEVLMEACEDVHGLSIHKAGRKRS
jgi:dihydrolipoamide dehydrogenase